MDKSADLGAADGAAATGAKDNLIIYKTANEILGACHGNRGEMVPNMPSFHTSLRYSCLSRGIVDGIGGEQLAA